MNDTLSAPTEFAFQWNGAGGLLFEQHLDADGVRTHINAGGVDFLLPVGGLTQVHEADGSNVLLGRNSGEFMLDEFTGTGIHHAWGGGAYLAYEQMLFNGDTCIYRQSAPDQLSLMVFHHDGSWLRLTLEGSSMHAQLVGTDHVTQTVEMDTAIALLGITSPAPD